MLGHSAETCGRAIASRWQPMGNWLWSILTGCAPTDLYYRGTASGPRDNIEERGPLPVTPRKPTLTIAWLGTLPVCGPDFAYSPGHNGRNNISEQYDKYQEIRIHRNVLKEISLRLERVPHSGQSVKETSDHRRRHDPAAVKKGADSQDPHTYVG